MAQQGEDWLPDLVEGLRVAPGSRVRLERDFDPADRLGLRKKRDGARLLRCGAELLAEYQRRLAAEEGHAVLVVLQAMDAAGKDSTIQHVMSGVNPQGVFVSSFKQPSAEELSHDYLWRHARRLPARGQIGIFNRSHYEEVLAVRVHPEYLDRARLPPEARGPDVWLRRYREINDWERYLVDNGVRVVKLFLNVSAEEQRARFLRRIDLPDKNWKFSAADVRERRFWADYQQAYAQMLSHTSTPWAPWHVLPADRKWLTRICAAAVIAQTLIDLDPRYPAPTEADRRELLVARAELADQAPPTAAVADSAQDAGRPPHDPAGADPAAERKGR
jgi:PPK2 family polyphosphate:nucleotide phosphotransferase